ncbi:hypothetical protein [Lewinella sp. W8]|uniref:hypothetical protein n=1 Tax=Lewinella sp. W8 TaxID=2528208 RepID=UPI001067F538|nr:hypothetical protein [Lewinella sp. W8]MTB51031.1 hypothetical protein [Lewinella sp. W8]
MNTTFRTPEELWRACWKLLNRARADKKHPYATPVVSSVDAEGLPSSRVLVLRTCEESAGWLEGYTDRRSAKAGHLHHPEAQFSWLFWDPKKQLQLRARGRTEFLPAEISSATFDQLPKHSRKAYATPEAPGTPLAEAGDGLPDDWDSRDLSATDYARDNFGIFRTTIETADILYLNRDGHRRVSAQRAPEGWDFRWVVP